MSIFSARRPPVFRSALASYMAAGVAGILAASPVGQVGIPAVDRMPALPEPLEIRPWQDVARQYYTAVFDPKKQGEGFPAVEVSGNTFRMKTYLGAGYDTEAFSCLAAVAGARLSGLDPTHLHDVDFVSRTEAWFDPAVGMFRHRAGQHGGEIHADIYGYWPAIQGLVLADLYPDHPLLQQHAGTTFTAFLRLAEGLGAPDHPDFSGLGWNFESRSPGGRNEPMNRLGNAPAVAWVLLAGAARTGSPAMAESSRSIMRWYAAHPGRYEITHIMGPLTASRLNAMGGPPLDLPPILNAWFGDGPSDRCPWWITSGTRVNGITCDGLDAAREGNDFYAFSMGSLQAPAWLVPVVRYDPRFARAIGRYALHAANSCRLLEGHGLDAGRQDHAAWKKAWDPADLFFYEGLRTSDPSSAHAPGPYATGDPVLNGWVSKMKPSREGYFRERDEWFGAKADNIALYMGNHVGFLGGIVETTDVPGILSWDCVKTDWFHPRAFPTKLVFNPHAKPQTVTLDVGKTKVHVYDLVSRTYVARDASGPTRFQLPADTAAVLVHIPTSSSPPRAVDGRLKSGETVIEWNTGL